LLDDKGAGAALDRMFDALSRGDLEGAADTLAPDGTVWHGFDRIVHDRASIMRDWEGFVSAFPERSFVDVRRQATEQGCVQQHLMVGRLQDGSRKAWPVCVVVRMNEDGRIARLDEYIDRTGAFPLAIDALAVTPGLS
jgi:ketosteroid isomerase-like protein